MITSCENESLLIETDLLQEGGGGRLVLMDSDWIPAGRTRKRGEDEEKNNNWAENVNKRSSEEERKMGGGQASVTS